MNNLEYVIIKSVKNLIKDVEINLPNDLIKKIEYYSSIKNPEIVKNFLNLMIKNCEIAKKLNIPICQDTGTPMFHIRLGDEFPIKSKIIELLNRCVIESTFEIPLRPNIVDPISGKNTGNNTGRYIPWIDIELINGDYVEIYFIPKGGGSELPCKAFTTPPENAWNKLVRYYLKLLTTYHAFPCPPLIIGIGIGASIDIAVQLAKKALYLRKIDERHENSKIAELEEKLVELGNKLNIGPHGVGGLPTIIDVHIEYSFRHVATFSIAFITSCWVYRRGGIRIYNTGKVERIL